MGFIFAIYACAAVVTSPYVSKNMLNKYKGGTLMGLGLLLMGSSFVLWSFIDKFEGNTWLIVAFSLLLRCMHGCGSGII